MMVEMEKLDTDLDKQVAKMNQAQGNAKVDAMAAALNDLVKEHNLMRQRMTEMRQRIMSHREQENEGMGGAQQSPGGTEQGAGGGSSSDTQTNQP